VGRRRLREQTGFWGNQGKIIKSRSPYYPNPETRKARTCEKQLRHSSEN
jgi:hypothetical protein